MAFPVHDFEASYELKEFSFMNVPLSIFSINIMLGTFVYVGCLKLLPIVSPGIHRPGQFLTERKKFFLISVFQYKNTSLKILKLVLKFLQNL